jgi:hypothetical protein
MRTYLEHMVAFRGKPPEGYKYSCFEAYVLAQGRPYVSEQIPEKDKKRVLAAVNRKGLRFPIKQCFANCLQFVLTCRIRGLKVTYCEGFASSIIPIHHAWLSVNGRVWDPTLRLHHTPGVRDDLATNRVWGELGEREYFGVEFDDVTFLARRTVETELFQSVIDDWQNDWPALKGTYDKEDRQRLVTADRSPEER